MDFVIRWLKRLVIFAAGAVTIWLIVTQVFDRLDQRVPVFIAVLGTYVIGAYAVIPSMLRLTLRLIRHKGVPSATSTADGLSADPVNLVVAGSRQRLEEALRAAGWYRAVPLGLRSAVRMAYAFVRNRPYPEAPFSSLYLFGRRQDFGYQKPIGDSPRRRHHVRFWRSDRDSAPVADSDEAWIGAATKDVGFGFASLTYKISHRVDRNVDEERAFVLEELRKTGLVEDDRQIDPGDSPSRRFVSDGDIALIRLKQ